MPRLEVTRKMGPDDVAAVTDLLDAAARADGDAPLGEPQWLALVQGGREGSAFVMAWEPRRARPVGYAQVARNPAWAAERGAQGWTLELVVDPDRRESGGDIGIPLVAAALDAVRGEGGGHVHLWVRTPQPWHEEVAAANGLTAGRELLQLRRPLPVEEPSRLDVRAFVPGQDEGAWLDVNNRAFDGHPEQGGWDRATLEGRKRQPWFDPEGFLLHEREGSLAGFCWTKIHADHEPPLGEIYVIAVNPDCKGTGLGRSLTLAGLDSLHRRGIGVGMLYVDAANAPAMRLYEDLGFAVHHRDRAYAADVA